MEPPKTPEMHKIQQKTLVEFFKDNNNITLVSYIFINYFGILKIRECCLDPAFVDISLMFNF